MTQSPACLRIAQSAWHSLPICVTDPQSASDRELVQLDPFAQYVFGKSAGKKRDVDLLLKTVHAFLAEQADLAVPVSGVGIPVDSVFRPEMHALDRMLLLPLLFTDADGLYRCGLGTHKQRLQNISFYYVIHHLLRFRQSFCLCPFVIPGANIY